MKSALIFIDGTICDDRHRVGLYGTAEFNSPTSILADKAVIGSVDFLNELAKEYTVLYIGARSSEALSLTIQWLKINGFPDGEVYLAQKQSERLKIVKELSSRKNIAIGIGDRWDDNQLHLEIGCMSIIVEEYAGDWNFVKKHILS